MVKDKKNDDVQIHFSRDEALVLFEWLGTFDTLHNVSIVDDAEQMVLWRLEAQLESSLVEIVQPEYKKNVALAKKNIMLKC